MKKKKKFPEFSDFPKFPDFKVPEVIKVRIQNLTNLLFFKFFLMKPKNFLLFFKPKKFRFFLIFVLFKPLLLLFFAVAILNSDRNFFVVFLFSKIFDFQTKILQLFLTSFFIRMLKISCFRRRRPPKVKTQKRVRKSPFINGHVDVAFSIT